jgi:hypothetical protein
MVRLYRPRYRLEQMICGVVTTIYNQGNTPIVDAITTTVIADARFNTIIMASQVEANRVLRRGVDRSVRNVLTNIRFGGGVYAGDRACLVVPVAGRKPATTGRGRGCSPPGTGSLGCGRTSPPTRPRPCARSTARSR